jgi:hypothetical protein
MDYNISEKHFPLIRFHPSCIYTSQNQQRNNAIPENFLTCHGGYVFSKHTCLPGMFTPIADQPQRTPFFSDRFPWQPAVPVISTVPLGLLCTSQIETIHVRASASTCMARPPGARARALLHASTAPPPSGLLPVLYYTEYSVLASCLPDRAEESRIQAWHMQKEDFPSHQNIGTYMKY